MASLMPSKMYDSSSDLSLKDCFKEKSELENILNGIGHGILIVNQDLKILRANSAMKEIIGRSPPELTGTSYKELCSDAGILDNACPLGEALRTGKITHAVKHCQTVGLQLDRYIKISCFPQKNPAGETTHAIVSLRNVSAIVRAEMLQKDLAHMIIHDIRNPLLAVARNLDLSARGVHGRISRSHSNIMQDTRESCELLLNMLDDLLDVYQYEAGKFQLNLRRVDIQKIVQKAYKTMETLADEKAVRIRFDLPENLPEVAGDETRLIRVMINLLDNAVKFSPNGSPVDVDGRLTSDDRLQIRVTNSGKAIPGESLEKIFRKFYQVDKETGIQQTGVGLGLPFCRLAIEAHGGRIWAESPIEPEGRGSRFHFIIPVGINGRT